MFKKETALQHCNDVPIGMLWVMTMPMPIGMLWFN
jgi:hypothetical protein